MAPFKEEAFLRELSAVVGSWRTLAEGYSNRAERQKDDYIRGLDKGQVIAFESAARSVDALLADYEKGTRTSGVAEIVARSEVLT